MPILAVARGNDFPEAMEIGRERLLTEKPLLEKKKYQLQGKRKTMVLLDKLYDHNKNIDEF